MSNIQIFYEVENSNKYFGSGKIQNITQRDDSKWKSLVEDSTIKLNLILKTPAKISKVDIKAENTDFINLIAKLEEKAIG